MSTVAGTNNAQTVLSSLNPSGANSANKAQDDPQQRFLKLLTAQLKNQDPLAPMDNAEFTSQISQMSTVTGIDKLNTTLESMAAAFNGGQSLQAAGLIGRDVLIPGDSLQLANGGAALGVDLPQPADKLVVLIKDASGTSIHRVDLGAQSAGVIPFQWDGIADSGAAAAPGRYSFEVQAVQGSTKINATALQLGQVASVTQAKGGVTLNLSGGAAVALADIRQIM